MTARVAVIVPCYDDGATLEEAVASVLAQDEPMELVVVDDGSSDPATIEAFDRLERDGVRVVHQANAGLGAARAAGVSATTAPYVLALDADDLLEPGALRHLADVLDAHPGAALAWGWYQRFGDETTLQRTAPTLDPWQISYMNELPATALLRRDALARTPGWRLRHFEDWDLWMSLAERGMRGIGTDRVIYRYRRDGLSLAHAGAARHEELLADLRTRHPELFAARRSSWRRSSAPLALRLALPLIERLPLGREGRRVLAGVTSHLAHRRGVRELLVRAREERARGSRA